VILQLNVLSGGYASDNRFFSGENVLSSVFFNWVPYYEYWIGQIVDGSCLIPICNERV
jgi:hypothetical protein